MIKNTYFQLQFVFISALFVIQSCQNPSTQNKNIAITPPTVNLYDSTDNKLELEIYNQIIKSIVDSLDTRIRINLGIDYNRYKYIFIGDSLSNLSWEWDSAFFRTYKLIYKNKDNLKIDIFNNKLRHNKSLMLVSSYDEYKKYVVEDNSNRALFSFTRIYFNSDYDKGVLKLWFSCSENSGAEYTIHLKRLNDIWSILRIYETAIR